MKNNKLTIEFDHGLPPDHAEIFNDFSDSSGPSCVLIECERLVGASYLLRCIAFNAMLNGGDAIVYSPSVFELKRDHYEGLNGIYEMIEPLGKLAKSSIKKTTFANGSLRLLSGQLQEVAMRSPDFLAVDDAGDVYSEDLGRLILAARAAGSQVALAVNAFQASTVAEIVSRAVQGDFERRILERKMLPEYLINALWTSVIDSQVLSSLDIAKRIGLTIDPWARETLDAFDSGHKRIAMLWSRQIGKSTCAAVMVVTALLSSKHSLVVVAAVAHEQSKIIVGMARKALDRMGLSGIVKGGNRTMNPEAMSLTNGSQAIALTSSGATSRGKSGPSVIFFDEAARGGDDYYNTVLKPMAAASGAKIVLMSNAGPEDGFFYETVKKAQQKKDLKEPLGKYDFFLTEAICSDCPRIPKEFLDEEKDLLPRSQFQSEYENVFLTLSDKPFQKDHINALLYGFTSRVPPGGDYTDIRVGIDWADIRDQCAFVVGDCVEHFRKSGKVSYESNFFDITEVDELKEKDYPEKSLAAATRIIHLAAHAPVTVYCDGTGVGQGPSQFLRVDIKNIEKSLLGLHPVLVGELTKSGYAFGNRDIEKISVKDIIYKISVWEVVFTGGLGTGGAYKPQDTKQTDDIVHEQEKRLTIPKQSAIRVLQSLIEQCRIGLDDSDPYVKLLVKQLNRYRIGLDKRETYGEDNEKRRHHFDLVIALLLCAFGPQSRDLSLNIGNAL